MKQYGEKYKEIFRYLSLGISRNEISKLLKTSRKTIRKVENAAESLRLTWNDASSMTSEEFSDKLFPKSNDDNDNLQPKGVAVIMEAEHMCMTMRGARAAGSKTQTSALRGIMRTDAKTRAEVLSLLK